MPLFSKINIPSTFLKKDSWIIDKFFVNYGYIEDGPGNDLHFTDSPMINTPLLSNPSLKECFKPISNQYNIGSCTANATADAFEAQVAQRRRVDPSQVEDFSRLFIYWNARNLNNPPTSYKDNGSKIRLAFDSMARYGAPYESVYPYITSKVNDRPSIIAYRQAMSHKIDKFYRISATGGDRISQIKQALSANCPVVFGTKIAESFKHINSDDVVILSPREGFIGGHAMCCLPGTYITTDKGLVNIEDIFIGDEVQTREGMNTVTKTTCQKVDEKIYTIHSQLSIEPLKVTSEHPILAKKCSSKTKYSLLNMKSMDFYKASELEKGHFIQTIIDDTVITNNISFGMARLLGYYIGNGNIKLSYSKNKNIKSAQLRLTYHRDDKKDIVNDLINIVENEFPGTKYSIYKAKKEKTNIITFYNTKLGKFILDICGDSKNKSCSKLLYLEPKKQKEIIKGWFKTDGCGQWMNNSKIFTSEKNLAQELIFMLQRNHITYYSQKRNSKLNIIKGKSCNTKGGWNIYFHKNNSKDRLYYDNGQIFTRITKIETENYKGPVYNLEVDNCHEYIANNIIVHNCIVGWSEAKQAFEVRNSWGTDWGVKGYCWMHKSYIASSITRDIWVPTI